MSNDPIWVDVDTVGASGKRYVGRFCIRPFLSLAQRADMARLHKTFTHGIEKETDIFYTLSLLAGISMHIMPTKDTKGAEPAPEWWNNYGLDLIDTEPVFALSESISKAIKEINNDASE